MSLEAKVTLLAQAIGDDVQTLLAQDGTLANLNTTAKGNLVAAINEVLAASAGNTDLSIGTNDGTTLQIVSSTGNNVTLTGATAVVAGLLSAAGFSKLDGIATGATANSSDATLLDRTNHTGSQLSTTISDFNTAVIAALDGDIAPALLNTIDELAAAIGDDENFATTMTTALANRVRYDASQTLDTAEQLQACTNIGVGDPEHDFTTDYTTSRDS